MATAYVSEPRDSDLVRVGIYLRRGQVKQVDAIGLSRNIRSRSEVVRLMVVGCLEAEKRREKARKGRGR